MRICKTFTFLSIFIVLFYNCSLPADDEDERNPEEDNTTSELPWEGETDKFTINSKEGLRLNDPQENAGTAYVTIPSNSVKNTRSPPYIQSFRQQLCSILPDFFFKCTLRQRKRLLYPNRRSQRQRCPLPAERRTTQAVGFGKGSDERKQLTQVIHKSGM